MASTDDLVNFGTGAAPSVTTDDLVNFSAAPTSSQAAAPAQSAKSGPTRSIPQELARQAGLTARYAAEGPAQVLDLFGQPIRAIGEMAGLPHTQSISSGVSNLLTRMGLPQPETPTERVVGDASRLLAAGGGIAGGASRLAQGATGGVRAVAQSLAQSPGMQGVSAVGSGLAGGAVRETGGSPGAQFAASLLGGLVAPWAASKIPMRNPFGAIPMETVDLKIEGILKDAGIDWSSISASAKQSLRAQVADAMKSGKPMNADAVRRAADFAMVNGATPTRGMLTLDPVQITREQNLAKAGANSSDAGLHGLAGVQSSNNNALIRSVNDAGAANAPSAYDAGQSVINALGENINAQRGNVNQLYSQARDSAGRSFPLDGRTFADTAIKQLDDNLLGSALPADVRKHINAISRGEVPFTVDYAEQLKTRIGNLQRATQDGQARMALGLVRKALDETPVLPLGQQAMNGATRNVNPGNLPAVAGGTQVGQEAISAFNAARRAHRDMMSAVEGSPALKAVFEETATPDAFMNKFVTGSSATAADVKALKDAMAASPKATDAVRSYVAQWLKGKALNGAADEVGNFSASAYNKALTSIGDQKLQQFFSPEELAQLKSVGRVASYMTHQPKGSAVNNSNSGAMIVGKGLDLLSMLGGKLPILGVGPQIQGIVRGVQQRAAMNVPPALLQKPPANQLLYPAPALGALAAQVGQND